MTPERIEEMGMTMALMEADMLNLIKRNKELLAALEEAEKPDIKSINKIKKLEADLQSALAVNQKYLCDIERINSKLAEAQQTIAGLEMVRAEERGYHERDCIEYQQTIARQREVWEELKGIVSTNATGGKGEDINDYDIMLNIMGDLESDQP